MRPSTIIQAHAASIRRIVLENGAQNPRFFGSTARGDDRDDSDLDLLVEPVPGITSLMSLVRIKRAIEALTGVATDVITPQGLNPRIRADVLRDAKPL